MALARRVRLLFDRRSSRSSGVSPKAIGSGPEAPRHSLARGSDESRRVSESTLESMFAYQDELSRMVPRQRRRAGRH